MGFKIVNFNPFARRAEEEEAADDPTSIALPSPATGTQSSEIVGLNKYGEAYDPFKALAATAQSPQNVREKPAERPGGLAAFADPQQYKEVAKGVPGGAVSFVGTGLQGLAAAPAAGQANAFKFGQKQQDVWERIDRGEQVPETEDPAGYQHMNPEQRRQMWADSGTAQGQYKPTVLAEQPLYQAGERVKEFSKTILPAAPGYEDAVGRQLGEGLGSLVAGIPFGLVGRVPATIFFGAGGAGESGSRAVEFDKAERAAGRPGLTQDQINGAALWGIAPGTTDMLPMETLLRGMKLPPVLAGAVARGLGRIGGQAFVEGVQEGGQAFLQNLIAREGYNPQQALTEGLAGEAAVGGGVGAISQALKEGFGLAVRGFAGGRRGMSRPGEAPSADPFAQPLTPAPGGEGVAVAEPIDVDFEDLVPADRRIAPPQSEEPAPQAGVEPPPLPVSRQAQPPSPPAAEPEMRPDAVEAAPVSPSARRGVDVLQFIRANGGLKPSRELGGMDAQRYPGLINSAGLDADKMREKMVEAGYLQEAGPDQPAVTTPADVYDLLGRAISGERIVPQEDLQADEAFWRTKAMRDFARELKASERNFIFPEMDRHGPALARGLRQAYAGLTPDERQEVIQRNQRGEDIVDLLEEKTTQNPLYYALGTPSGKAKSYRYVPETQELYRARPGKDGGQTDWEHVGDYTPDELPGAIGETMAAKLLAQPLVNDTEVSPYSYQVVDPAQFRPRLDELAARRPDLANDIATAKTLASPLEQAVFLDKMRDRPLDQKLIKSALEGEQNAKGRERAGDRGGRDAGGSLAPLKGAPTVAGATGPDPNIVAAAEQYAKSIGIDLKRQASFAEIDEALATRIAGAYEEMAHNPRDPMVAAAYADMIQQTIAQYRALEDAGFQFYFYDEATDPYGGNPWNAIRDLRQNKRMAVFATEAGFGSGVTDLNVDDSPMLADTGIQWAYGTPNGPKKRVLANDLFRAVHDAFGHSMEGAGFRARGEENAWQAHIRLYKGPAVGAVTTETRGQNSWLNFGPFGEQNRTASPQDTVFADQKIGLMPSWTWEQGRVADEGDLAYAVNFGRRARKAAAPKTPERPYEPDEEEISNAAYEIYDDLKDKAVYEHMKEWDDEHHPENFEIDTYFDSNHDLKESDYLDILASAQKELKAAREAIRNQLLLPFAEGIGSAKQPKLKDFLPTDFEPGYYYTIDKPYGNGQVTESDVEYYTKEEAYDAAESDREALVDDHGAAYYREAERYADYSDFSELWDQAYKDAKEKLFYEARAHQEDEDDASDAPTPSAPARFGWNASERAVREQIRATLARDEAYDLPTSLVDGVFDAIRPAMPAVPSDHTVAVLTRIQPVNVSLERNAKAKSLFGQRWDLLSEGQKNRVEQELRGDRVIAVYRDRDSKTPRSIEIDLDTLFGVRAFYIQSGTRPTIVFTRLSPAGEFDQSLRGELWHEVTHALRIQGRIDPVTWTQLLDHAKTLQILDRPLKDYLTTIGHPLAAETEAGLTLRDAYEEAYEAYEGTGTMQELLNQEAVAHLVELYSHGALDIKEIAPVASILGGIVDGEYSRRAPWNQVHSKIDRALSPKIKQLLKEQIDAIRESAARAGRGDPTGLGQAGGITAEAGGAVSAGQSRSAPITPGYDDFARSARLGESLARRTVSGRLRDNSIERYLGGWFTPKARELRAEMQGFTWPAWHGTKDDKFLVPKSYIENKDFGFHMAINRPNAANERLHMTNTDPFSVKDFQSDTTTGFNLSRLNANVMPLLVKASNPFRTADLGFWAAPSQWRGVGDWYAAYMDKPSTDPNAMAVAGKISDLVSGFKYGGYNSTERYKEFQDELTTLLEDYGFDSIIYRNDAEDSGNDSLFVWDPTRVRSRHDLFHPRAVNQPGLFASTPFLEAELRERLNDLLAEEGLPPMYALAGKRAIGAPKESMAAAERMEAKGGKPESIWQATGSYRGPDGKWRWEIDDSAARIINLDKILAEPVKKQSMLSKLFGQKAKAGGAAKPADVVEKKNVPLLNLLHHPKLYNAYPFLRQMRVDLTYAPDNPTVESGALRYSTAKWKENPKKPVNVRIYKPIKVMANSPESIKSVLLHEIQHYIQMREGFAEGSDIQQREPHEIPIAKPGERPARMPLYDPARGDQKKDGRFGSRREAGSVNARLIAPTEAEQNALRIMGLAEELDAIDSGERDAPNGRARNRQEAEDWMQRYGQRLEESMLVRPEDYENSFGEFEARSVQERANMTPEQRRRSFPLAGKPDDMIVSKTQTRDYDKAYDEIMRRAEVFKRIEENWKQRRDVGGGVSAVRIEEDRVDYAKNPEQPLVEVKLYQTVGGSEISFTEEFLELPYAEQKAVVDKVIADTRKTFNVRPAVQGLDNDDVYDSTVDFWARYDPRMVAFDLRLYRDRVDELIREQFGEDAEITEFLPTEPSVQVQTAEDRKAYEEGRKKIDEAQAKLQDVRVALVEKYGSIKDVREKGDPGDQKKLRDAEDKYAQATSEWNYRDHYSNVDLTPIYGDRLYNPAPRGIDAEAWELWRAEEQLMANGKFGRGDEGLDFSDLIPQ